MSRPRIPDITHLQFLVLGMLRGGERLGRTVRRSLARHGVARTGPAFYQMMARLEDAGLVSRPRGPQPRSVRLEAQAFDLLDTWIERYRSRIEQRYRRLDAVLAELKGDEH